MNGDCEIQFVDSENQLADLFTKPLNKERFNFLKNELGIIDFKNVNLFWKQITDWIVFQLIVNQ